MDKYRACSLDQRNWWAEIWIDYERHYVRIQSSPCFATPQAALVWATTCFN